MERSETNAELNFSQGAASFNRASRMLMSSQAIMPKKQPWVTSQKNGAALGSHLAATAPSDLTGRASPFVDQSSGRQHQLRSSVKKPVHIAMTRPQTQDKLFRQRPGRTTKDGEEQKEGVLNEGCGQGLPQQPAFAQSSRNRPQTTDLNNKAIRRQLRTNHQAVSNNKFLVGSDSGSSQHPFAPTH